jgi:hypothetical protein
VIASLVHRRWPAVAGVAALLIAVSGAAILASARPASGPSSTTSPGLAIGSAVLAGSDTADESIVSVGSTADPTPLATGPSISPLNLFVSPSPAPKHGAQATDPAFAQDAHRPTTPQSMEWLLAKAAGRVALVGPNVTDLGAGANPLVDPVTYVPIPAARTLDTSWTRWVVEPTGSGRDAKDNRYSNLNYWNLCSPGSVTVALWYWQRLTGGPDVTGTAGWFVEPYVTEAGGWPSPGPTEPRSADGSRLGTFWGPSDRVNGFTANGRGFLMYLATATRPPTWTSTGMVVYANASGEALYPTRGGPRSNIVSALNWEASGRDVSSWAETWYASVIRPDPALARDLSLAVTLDVGRDGVPVVAVLDTHGLPNWQAGSATPHIRHAVAIVGYDNAANPPTFTYIDTCGRSCNVRGGNQNGQLHVISQAGMVAAIRDTVGSGFVW